MDTLECTVERITYQNSENGYAVIRTNVKGIDDLVTVVGTMFDVNVGARLLLDGNWVIDQRYGKQFSVSRYEEKMPATALGIQKYLGSGMIKGIGPSAAKKIVDAFGVDAIDVIENDPERLKTVKGIGSAKITIIVEGWAKQKEVKNIMIFLQGHNISPAYAVKIYKAYGDQSIARVKKNPYCLADDIWGIGFKSADTIAGNLGIPKDSPLRIRSGILYTLSCMADEGHVYLTKEDLVYEATKILECPENIVIRLIDEMKTSGDLLGEDDLEYLPAFYYAETGIASKLSRLMHEPGEDHLWDLAKNYGPDCIHVNKIEKELGIEYDEIQKDAIIRSGMSKIMVLTGGPGTGKTTTVNGILKSFTENGLEVVLAAPTGRAAKRMSEATGMEAKTIHRLLECKSPYAYDRNENNPLEGDALVVDECSMIDTVLMNSLLKAIPKSMRLILVGDVDQLPSVGAGNVLKDIISSGAVPVVKLEKIFRQAQSSRIITNAHMINKGIMPNLSNGKTDFYFVKKENPEEASDEIVDLVASKLARYYNVESKTIQTLVPMQKGVVGALELNKRLQEKINPVGPGIKYGATVFRLGDKVMQMKNNYDKSIFNGDVGFITEVNEEEKALKVDFDSKIVEYPAEDLDEITLAYATTIHKSQGSEYPIVVMPIMMTNFIMLQRNLLYTGVTRAKKAMIIVGTKKAIGCAVSRVSANKRNTKLAQRLKSIENIA